MIYQSKKSNRLIKSHKTSYIHNGPLFFPSIWTCLWEKVGAQKPTEEPTTAWAWTGRWPRLIDLQGGKWSSLGCWSTGNAKTFTGIWPLSLSLSYPHKKTADGKVIHCCASPRYHHVKDKRASPFGVPVCDIRQSKPEILACSLRSIFHNGSSDAKLPP